VIILPICRVTETTGICGRERGRDLAQGEAAGGLAMDLRVISCVSVWALSLGSSLAQPADRLTDQQRRAGYCVGVMQERFTTLGPAPAPRSLDAIVAELKAKRSYSSDKLLMMHARSTASLEETKRSSVQAADDARRRFLSYLTATGALTGSDNPLGIDVARKEGTEDQKQCDPPANHCIEENTKSRPPRSWDEMSEKDRQEWYQKSAQQLIKCWDDIPACAKTRRCAQFLNELPF